LKIIKSAANAGTFSKAHALKTCVPVAQQKFIPNAWSRFVGY
jgi:hypothetical protein